MDKYRQKTIESAKKVAGKMYDVSDYESNEQLEKGTAITHEQATDDYTEGTIDGKVDKLDNNDELISHDGKSIQRKDLDE